MVKYCAFLLLLLGLTACGSSDEESSEELANNFHLEGTITGASLQKVKIEALRPTERSQLLKQ